MSFCAWPPGSFSHSLFHLCPRVPIHLSRSQRRNPPGFWNNLSRAPNLIGTVAAVEKRATELTSGGLAPVKWSRRSGRFRRTRRGSDGGRWWSESFWSRTGAGEVVSGEELGLYTVVEFN
jgi:hypothetical protein